jgi:serine/threonine protein kinase
MATPSQSSGADHPPTVARFLKSVLRSGLLDREGLQAALRGVPREQRDDALALADHLVKTGYLSRFQARKLLKGAALGLILGPYQVLAPIGRGGMGTVYMARDSRSGGLVALKVLPPHRARAEERMLARFRREMELSRRVAHPHLAWTYEVGQVRSVYYIAMEYIPGKNLSRLVAADGPLEVPRAARLMAEVASGLQHAHNQGLIHRDLKPSNILVTPNGHAKVLDLGLALIQGETGDTSVVGGQGYIVGTMDYIAPEQTADPSKVDRRSDIYSLGCTLYYALTGQPPFPGGTRKEKIHRHRTEEPVPLGELRPTLPPAFAALVSKMMAKDPADRFPSAVAVEAELRPWANEEPDLPLDRPDDPPYAAAVTMLRTREPSTEYSLSDLGLAEAAPAEEPKEPAAQETDPLPPPLDVLELLEGPAWSVPLQIGLTLLFLIGLAGIGLLVLWLL